MAITGDDSLQMPSFTDIRTALRTNLRAPSGTNPLVTDAELNECIIRACSDVARFLQVQDLTTITVASNTREYELPQYVDRILKLRRPGGWWQGVNLDEGAPIIIQRYDHLWNGRVNTLRLLDLHPVDITITVEYLRSMPVPPVPLTLSGNINATVVDIPITGAANTYPVPGWVKIGSEVIYYTTLDDNELKTATRGMSGSLAASHTSGDVVDPLLPIDMRTREVVLKGAKLYALELRLQDGPASESSLLLSLVGAARQDYLDARRTVGGNLPSPIIPNVYRTRRRRGLVVR
jgi:hypothetical protein